MNKIKMAVAILAASALAAPAVAGSWTEPTVETPPAPPPVAAAYDWTGAYVGATAGFANVTAGGFSESGAVYGGFVGYNQQMGGMVLGGELELTASNIEIMGMGIDRAARLKGRLGFARDNMLVYAVGGVAHASVDGLSDWGYFGGAGVEFGLGNNWVGGIEATHNRFNDFDGSGVNARANVATARVAYRF